MLVVATHPIPRGICWASTCRPVSPTAETGGRSVSHRTPARCRRSSAIRAGWCTAPSPPGNAKGARCPTRVNPHAPESARTSPPPQMVPSGAVAGSVVGDREHRAAEAGVLGQQRHRVGMMMLHITDRSTPGVAPSEWSHIRGCISQTMRPWRRSVMRARCSSVAEKQDCVRGSAISPRCDDRCACPSDPQQAEGRLEIAARRQDDGSVGNRNRHRQWRVSPETGARAAWRPPDRRRSAPSPHTQREWAGRGTARRRQAR